MINENVFDKYGLNHQEINISTNLVSAYISEAKPSFKGQYTDYKNEPSMQNDFIGVVHTIKGTGKILTTEREFSVGENTVLFVHYRSCVNFTATDYWKFYTIWFRINNFKINFNKVYEVAPVDREEERIEEIINLLNTDDYINCCKANTIAQSLILDIHSRIGEGDDASPYAESMKKIALYISQNINDNLQVTDLAKICSFSKNHFFKVFKQFFKISPKEYIMREKLKKASFLLLNTPMQIASIAEELSFYSAAHFTSCFKKVYNITPYEFRRHKGQRREL